MKYALFSDIHGNIYAFEAMMNELRHEEIDGYLFCGDLTGYYYHAREIMEFIERLPNFYAVRGNHDELFLNALSNNGTQYEAIKKYGSSYKNLDAKIAKYIQTLPEVLTLNIGRYHVAVLHGSPMAPLLGRIYPDSEIDLPPLEYDFLFVGHTHYQMVRLHEKNCKIVNPGSLGQPRDGKGFCYCIIDFATGNVEHKCVEFDKSLLLKEIAERDAEIAYLSEVLNRNRRG